MAWIGQIRGDKIYTEEGWQPLPPRTWETGDVPLKRDWQLASDQLIASGFVIPPGAPSMPSREDYPAGAAGNTAYQADFYGWQEIIYALGGGMPDEDDAAGAAGPTPEQLAIERSKVHAQNMATYLNATVGQIDAEIAAGRLRLDQAQAEFDRRMDAFAEGGKQMGEMWQWTVPEGTTTIHGDLRANLGMEPWESQAIPFDPFAMAWDIVEQTPEILQESPSFDPLTEALDLAKQFV